MASDRENMQSNNRSRFAAVCKTVWEYLMLALGAAIAAFAIEEFLVPCDILDGGVVGVSMIINHITHVRLGLLTLGKRFLHQSRLCHDRLFGLSGSVCAA